MPELDEAYYLVEYWHDAGTVSKGGMGISELTWEEIRAWKLENYPWLGNFETRLIRRLSQEYCGEYHAASASDRPAPYDVQEYQLDRTLISNKIGNTLRSLMKAGKEPRYTVEDKE